ncbi:hypothetical protein HS088_TW11G00623 [Tripterygium wilfordii]|uniref:Uncharacterized protein n=1 Tax=Tripterygium wilfordii TaxID=458696 RepID=A0A7J7D2J3_TRIWF|nr:hypothetical protein HS088_TW11G00623 [Tripterygium wilfordii]
MWAREPISSSFRSVRLSRNGWNRVRTFARDGLSQDWLSVLACSQDWVSGEDLTAPMKKGDSCEGLRTGGAVAVVGM